MDQDAKRRHYEKLERQRIKELEEKRQEEEAHKKKCTSVLRGVIIIV